MARTVQVTFADWLRDELDDRGWGVRTLARKIDPANPEVPRRAINRYMAGALPTEPYAVAIAAALNVGRSEMPIKEAARPGDPFRSARGRPGDRARGARNGGPVKDAA